MDTQAAIGVLAAPGIISGLLGVIKWAGVEKTRLGGLADVKRAAAILLGVGYGLAADAAGVIEADNAVIAGLLGITLGLAAMGWRDGVPGVRHFGGAE